MLKHAYKVRYWSPVKRVPIAYDGWYNPIEYEDIEDPEDESSSDFFYFLKFFVWVQKDESL